MSIGTGGGRQAWAEANGLTPRLQFSHNLSRVVPVTLFDEHPELFPRIAGERWKPPPGRVSWNPDLGEPATVRVAAEAANAYFEQHPDAVSFALGVNDGLRFGESAATRRWIEPVRWFRQRPDYSDLVFSFMNAVASASGPTWPDSHFGALAYYWCENVPSFPVHPQVLPFLTADRSQFYDRRFRREELELQRRWADAGPRRLGVYDYLYGAGFLIPRIHTRALAEHLRHARRVGFTDYYAEVYPNWGLDGPQPWLVAQLLQDPEQPVDRLLDEYYRRYFRTAARPMRRFFEQCERIWSTQPGGAYWLKHYRNESQADLFPPDVCATLRRELDAARVSAADDAVASARVRLVSDAFGVTERFSAMHHARTRLARELLRQVPDRREHADEGYEEAGVQRLQRELATYRDARAAFLRYLDVLEETQPLALHRYDVDDFVRHDPALTAARMLERRATDERSDEDSTRPRHTSPTNASSRWDFTGPLEPALEIGGLPYGVSLPAGWMSTVEPWEGLVAQVEGEPDNRVLRFEANKLTMLYRWVEVPGADLVRASVEVRGGVGVSSIVALSLGWTDRNHQRVGTPTEVRLPEGGWPDWVVLENVAPRPEGGHWLGVMVWVAHQQPGDWLEVRRVEAGAASLGR